MEELNQAFEVWKQAEDFVFTFPGSAFEEVGPGQSNTISYEQKVIVEQENTFKPRLSEEQLSDIA